MPNSPLDELLLLGLIADLVAMLFFLGRSTPAFTPARKPPRNGTQGRRKRYRRLTANPPQFKSLNTERKAEHVAGPMMALEYIHQHMERHPTQQIAEHSTPYRHTEKHTDQVRQNRHSDWLVHGLPSKQPPFR